MGKKSICCALITDYYNRMNKHLSCQLLRYELLPGGCDAIWISPHATFDVKKSPSNEWPVKCEKSCSQGTLLATGSDVCTISLSRLGSRRPPEEHFCMSSCAPVLFTSVLSFSTSQKEHWLNLDKYTQQRLKLNLLCIWLRDKKWTHK